MRGTKGKHWKWSEKSKLKLSKYRTGKKFPNQAKSLKKHWKKYGHSCLGRVLSKKTKEKIRQKMIGCNVNEKHYLWKGNKVSIGTLHHWIGRKLGKPQICEFCKKSGLKGHNIHWANKSGKYKRNLSDWLRLCVSCHAKYDKNWTKRKRNSAGQFS